MRRLQLTAGLFQMTIVLSSSLALGLSALWIMAQK
jgi:hypothetical protein